MLVLYGGKTSTGARKITRRYNKGCKNILYIFNAFGAVQLMGERSVEVGLPCGMITIYV